MDVVPVVVLVGADKGGTGKTTVARALIDYAAERGIHPRLIDTQYPKGGLKGFYPSAEIVDLAKATGQMEVFDKPAPLTVIDVRGGLLGRTVEILDRLGIIADARAGQIRIVLLYLLGPSVESLNEVVEAGRAIGDKVTLFLVRNHTTEGDDYFGWENDQRFGAALSAMAPITLDVQHLEQRAAEAVQREGKPFSVFAAGEYDAVDASDLSLVLRRYVRAWFAEVRSQFDKIGLGDLLGHPSPWGGMAAGG